MTAVLVNVIATRRRRGRIIPLGASAFENVPLFGDLTVAFTGVLPDIQHLTAATFDNEQQFGAPVVERMAGEITASLAASTVINAQQFGEIALALIDPVLLSAAAFDNAHEFGDLALSLPLQIAAPTIVNAQQFGDLTLSFLAAEIELDAAPFDNDQEFETQTVVVGMFVETSYDFLGGKGDRTAFITVTASGGPSSGSYGNWVDGAFANNNADSWWWSSSAAHWFQWNFTAMDPAGVVIDEITFHQSNATTHATYQLKGSMDGASWTDIGSSFVLGGQTVGVRSFPQVNYFAHYRMERVSGSFSSSPWMQEVEFKISATPTPPGIVVTHAAAEAVVMPPLSLRATQALTELAAHVPPQPRITQGLVEVLVALPTIDGSATNVQFYNADDAATGFRLDMMRVLNLAYLDAGAANVERCVRGVTPLTGKKYWEVRVLPLDGGPPIGAVGIGTASTSLSAQPGSEAASVGYLPSGQVRAAGALVTTIASYGAAVIMVAFDADTRKVWFGVNGAWSGDPAAGTGEAATLPEGTYYPLDSVPNRNSFKVGQHFIPRQHYSVPSGFSTWTSPYVGGWSGSIFLQGA